METGVLTKPEYKGGSSGKPGDGVSAPSCRLCISKLSSTSLLPWEAFTSAGHGRISGCPQYPSLWDGRLLTKLSLSLESCPLLELFLRGQLAILRSAQDWGSEDLCAVPTSATNKLGDLERLGLGFLSCSLWTSWPILTPCTVLQALQFLGPLPTQRCLHPQQPGAPVLCQPAKMQSAQGIWFVGAMIPFEAGSRI